MTDLAFNHVHAPNSCGANFCGTSKRGPIGDAVQEMDWAVGHVMDTVRSPALGLGDNTLVFFTSDNGAPMRPDGNLPLRGYKTSIWEGGFREPGIAWWPGRIAAGRASDSLVATYDIFPTVMQLAGAGGALPAGLVLDGIDLSSVLFGSPSTPSIQSGGAGHESGGAGHDCIMFYHSPHTAHDAMALTSLAAIRCGKYKVYWLVDQTSSTPLPAGITTGVRSLDDPLIFDLSTDWSEDRPLTPNSSDWKAAKTAAEAARLRHVTSLTPVLNQMDLGSGHEYAICGAPNSKAKYPDLPNCTVTPGNWAPPICLTGGSIDQCIGQTLCQPGCKFVNCSDQVPSSGETSDAPGGFSLPRGEVPGAVVDYPNQEGFGPDRFASSLSSPPS
jgi:arylsulfatase A